MIDLETIVLDRHGVFEFDSPALAELVTAAGNNYCFNDFCGNSTCAQVACAQAACVGVDYPTVPRVPSGNLVCPPMPSPQSRCYTP